MKTPPTMQILADAAGVSRNTISLALRNSPRISQPMRDRIQALATQLGYRPNPLISTLMAQRSGKKRASLIFPLALLHCHSEKDALQSPVYTLLLDGIRRRSEELGFDAQIFAMNIPGAPTSARLDQILRTRGIRGVIVLPLPFEIERLDFPWEFYAIATLGHSLVSPNIHRAASDQFGNGWHAMQNIHRLGYRRPGLLISAELDRRTHFHFSGAYLSFPREHPEVQIAPPFSYVNEVKPSALRRWLKTAKPDVILDHGDHRALLSDMGLQIPEKIGLVNLNQLTITNHQPPDETSPGLESNSHVSGINPLLELVGAGAVDIAVARLHRSEFGPPNHSRTMLVSGEWIEGKTTRVQ